MCTLHHNGAPTGAALLDRPLQVRNLHLAVGARCDQPVSLCPAQAQFLPLELESAVAELDYLAGPQGVILDRPAIGAA